MQTIPGNMHDWSATDVGCWLMLSMLIHRTISTAHACCYVARRTKPAKKSFNRRWAKGEGLRIAWIAHAGHNANTDQPEVVNQLTANFLKEIEDMQSSIEYDRKHLI